VQEPGDEDFDCYSDTRWREIRLEAVGHSWEGRVRDIMHQVQCTAAGEFPCVLLNLMDISDGSKRSCMFLQAREVWVDFPPYCLGLVVVRTSLLQ
jgi:hypothetical protein